MSDTTYTEKSKFIKSQDIRIFPYAQDRSTDPFGKHLSEQNLTNLVKHMCTFDSFFIGCKDVTDSRKIDDRDMHVYKLCEFMLAGHYINVIVTLPIESDEESLEERAFWLNNDVYAEITHYNASDRYNDLVANKSETDTAVPLDVSYLQVLGKDHIENDLSTFQCVRFVSVPHQDPIQLPVRQTQYKPITIDDTDSSGATINLKVDARITSLRLFDGRDEIVVPPDGWKNYDLTAHVPDEAWLRFEQRTYSQLKWKSY